MKRNLYIGLAAFAALTLSACQREAKIDNSAKMVTITLTADKAGDTRAAANEGTDKVTYTWTDTDIANLKLMSVTLVTEGDKTTENFEEVEKTTTLSSDNRTLSITATVEAGTVLRAAVASEWTGKEGDKTRKPRQPKIQRPSATNFDPAADILVSEDVTATGALEEEMLTFTRPVTVNKMTLKGMVAGETVSKVTITSDKDLVGYYQYDKSQMSAQHKDVTLQYDTPLAVPSSGEFPVYFTAMPGEGNTLNFVVETSKDSKNYRYVVNGIGTINFTQGKFARISVDLDGYREEIKDENYSGEWVIGGSNGTKALAATIYSTGNFYPVAEVEIEDDVVTVTSSPEDYKMTVTRVTSGEYAGLYTIVDAGGKYLTANTAANNSMIGVDTPTANSYWSIAKEADGTYEILAAKLDDAKAKMMCVNFSSPRVSCYGLTTTQKKVTLYPYAKIEVAEPPATGFQFQKVSAVTSGKQYLIVANDGSKLRAAKPITSNYGYPTADEVIDVDGVITMASMDDAYTFTSATGGFTIKQSDDRFLYIDATHTSFQVSDNPTEGQVFTAVKNSDGTFKITNVLREKYVQYSIGHSSYGCYADAQQNAVMPYLYEYVGEGGTTPTTYAVNITTPTNGTVTASKTSGIAAGESVTLTIAPATNYQLESLTVDGTNVTSSVSANKYTFSMPAHDVAVSASFKQSGSSTIEKGATWSYTFTEKKFAKAGTVELDGKDWTMSGTGNGFFNYDGTKGQQFGSGSNPYSALTLSSNFGSTYGIESIAINTSGASSIAATVSVSVDGVAFKCSGSETVSLTTTPTTYTFNSPSGLKAGDIVISYVQTSSKAIYVKTITVNPAGTIVDPVKLVMSDIACTNSGENENTLTFSWEAVENAVGYQVSTDGGTTFGDTQSATTYTWNGLEAGTTYTLKVKAIGDGTNYEDSEPKSCAGSTKASQSGTDVYSLYSGALTEGDYLIVYNGGAMKNTVSSSRLQYSEVTVSTDNKITGPSDALVWHIAKSGSYWTIYSEDAGKYAAGTGVANKAQLLADGTDDKSLWSVTESEGTYDFTNKANSAASVNFTLRRNGTYGFACYSTSIGGALSLYKKN